MASTPFTLAALATSAVPGLTVTGTRDHTSGSGGAFLSAVLETDLGEVIVRVPQTPAAEVQQSGELLGLAALDEGARPGLPFAFPSTLGLTRAGDTRAVVSTFLPGEAVSTSQIESDGDLQAGIAAAIAAVHELPIGIVQNGGLPVRSAGDVRGLAGRLVQRAADTGVLPATVRQRWQEALDSNALWSFEPTVIHGSLDEEKLLVEGHGEQALGVLGWSELSIGDPANDFTWLLAAGEATVFEPVFARYAALRDASNQRHLTARAKFYHELEVAKWLLHGVESHDQSVVDDAVAMLDQLVDRLNLLGAPLPQQAVLSERQVAQLLDETPAVEFDQRSETAEFEALDEDRVFAADSDFEEHATSEGSDSAGSEQTSAEDSPGDRD